MESYKEYLRTNHIYRQSLKQHDRIVSSIFDVDFAARKSRIFN